MIKKSRKVYIYTAWFKSTLEHAFEVKPNEVNSMPISYMVAIVLETVAIILPPNSSFNLAIMPQAQSCLR